MLHGSHSPPLITYEPIYQPYFHNANVKVFIWFEQFVLDYVIFDLIIGPSIFTCEKLDP
jgi:hypothetical protein